MNGDEFSSELAFRAWSRRQWMQWASACWVGTMLPTSARSASDSTQRSSPVEGKDPRLKVVEAEPLSLETPIPILAENRVTPSKYLFVRNNQEFPRSRTLKPLESRDWSIEIMDLVEFPKTITVADLEKMEQTEVEMVLQCSGNSRALFSKAAMTKGMQWGRGGIGNVRFSGVRFATVLDQAGVKPGEAARYLTAEGKDGPAKPSEADFEHSVPLDVAMERAVIALKLNGEPLPAIHGGPVRFVVPGYYATMSVKWLHRIRLMATETANHHQVPRYRVPLEPIAPGSSFQATLTNSRPNWDMKVNSIITDPINDSTVKERVTVSGFAWNDGRCPLDTVEVSGDGGRNWQRATLGPANGPFAWRTFSHSLTLPIGESALCARAIDAWGRTQPMDGTLFWNPSGYEWNGVEKIVVKVASG